MAKKKNPLVSIIVPIYKVEEYIDRCIDSLRGQTYENLEIILVDDGSPDECPALCDGFARLDSRIKVIHKENGGLSSARNAGTNIATGDYILYVDSDDWIDEQTVEVLLKIIESTDADVAICNHMSVSSLSHHYQEVTYDAEVFSSNEAIMKLLDSEPTKYIVAWGKLYKKSVLDGIRYPEKRLHEDEFVIHKIYAKAEKVAFSPNKLYFYFQRPGSIIHSKNDKNKIDTLDAFLERLKFLKENKPEIYLDYASAFINHLKYKFVEAFTCKSLSKEQKTAYKTQIKSIYADLKQKKKLPKKKLNLWLAINHPKLWNMLKSII